MRFTLRHDDVSLLDRAPIINRQAVTVDAPPAAVWPAFAEASAWPEWWGDMRAASYTSQPPHDVGSTRMVRFAGLQVDERILAFDVGERFAFVVERASVPFLQAMVEQVRLEPSAGGTRVTYTQAVELKRWFAPLSGVFERQLRRSLEHGLAGLASWLERRATG